MHTQTLLLWHSPSQGSVYRVFLLQIRHSYTYSPCAPVFLWITIGLLFSSNLSVFIHFHLHLFLLLHLPLYFSPHALNHRCVPFPTCTNLNKLISHSVVSQVNLVLVSSVSTFHFHTAQLAWRCTNCHSKHAQTHSLTYNRVQCIISKYRQEHVMGNVTFPWAHLFRHWIDRRWTPMKEKDKYKSTVVAILHRSSSNEDKTYKSYLILYHLNS